MLEKSNITMEKFNQINTGMTYSQVVNIIGFEGTISSQAGNIKTYTWEQSSKIISVVFTNDKVSAKSQIGLSGKSSEIEKQNETKQQLAIKQNPVATMEIKDYGVIKIELYPEIAPNTVSNFIALANGEFYDNLIIHRVVKDFIIQGGDSQGDGTGGPSLSDIDSSIIKGSSKDKLYSINGEFTKNGYNNTLKHERGVISMARSDYSSVELTKEGYNSAGSQFFICLSDTPDLNGQYAGFGKVISGMNIIDKIADVELGSDEAGDVEPSKPKEDILISSIRVDTKGCEYGKPETHETFDYQAWYMKQYYGIE